jgi:hypothetical protein
MVRMTGSSSSSSGSLHSNSRTGSSRLVLQQVLQLLQLLLLALLLQMNMVVVWLMLARTRHLVPYRVLLGC